MKLKTSAIALAVAGIVAAPMAAQADSGFYGSARVGINIHGSDVDADEYTKIGSHSSRFGFKGSNDLGNGMTSFARYEVGVSDKSKTGDAAGSTSDSLTLRELSVGVRGDFGEVKVGSHTYATFYNHLVAPVDICWKKCGITGVPLSNGRTSNVINYEGGSGAVKFGLAYQATGEIINGEDEGQGIQAAISFDAGPVVLALGVDSRDKNDINATDGGDIKGFTISGDAGDVAYALNLQSDDNNDVYEGYLGYDNFYLQFGERDVDNTDVDPSYWSLGYTQALGANTSMYYEYGQEDTGAANGETSDFYAVLKVDWK